MSNTFEIRDLRSQGWVWTSKALLFDERVDASQYKVYCGLAAYADNDTQEAFPSMVTLAEKLHLGKNTVIRAIAKLDENKLIRREKSKGAHNVYFLLDIACAAAPGFAPTVKVEKPKGKPKTDVVHNPLGAEIIEAFIPINPQCKRMYGNVTQRKACDALIEDHTLEHVLRVIAYLPQSNKMSFLPNITTPVKLAEKWADLENGLHKLKNKAEAKGRGIA